MIDDNGTIKIMDFGIAYLVNQQALTMTGAFVGTPNYVSPEQAQCHILTEKTDIFSVGCLLYEAAAGKPAFVFLIILLLPLKKLLLFYI